MDALQPGVYIPRTNESGEQQFLTIDEYIEEEGLREELEELPPWLQSLVKRMIENAQLVQTNPEAFMDGLSRRLPQMMFFLLPVFGLMLWLFYLGSHYHYLQHLVFSLHYHTVAFMAFLLLYPINLILPGDYGGIVTLVLMIYLPIALRGAYGGPTWGWLIKGIVLGLSYYFVVILTGTLVALMTLVFL